VPSEPFDRAADATDPRATREAAGSLVTRLADLRTYLHAPHVLAEICGELGVPFRASGYGYSW
jgi:hypothetical protein